MTTSTERQALLGQHLPLLAGILRGIEKEGLRVDDKGRLAMTPHPRELGSALTNPHITTDYSEALLELITGTHNSTRSLIEELENTHRFVARHIPQELIWNQSMPALLPPESEIPIAWYGTSNTGMLKHVYRRGLAERYGRAMQCIAGLHYNFSLPDSIWGLLNTPGDSIEAQRSNGYMALIRNFTRYSWLLMYLFGASPAVPKHFLRNVDHGLEQLDDTTLYTPYATSLRMSDLGYKSPVQSDLTLCYNDIDTFLQRMYDAVTTPWPAYEKIGTHRDGQWIQLSTSVLQIENEYYSSIRPKRSTGRCERPVTALAARGVQYIEVRCMDIDPHSPVGITEETSRFLDAFLLFCAVEDSRAFPEPGVCRDSQDNFSLVAKEGRKPGLKLIDRNSPVSLQDWGTELIERIGQYAAIFDAAEGGDAYSTAVSAQAPKIADSKLTPSFQLLDTLRREKLSFHEHALQLSKRHHEALRAAPLEPDTERHFLQAAQQSIEEQARLENEKTESFDAYVERYHSALKRPIPQH